MDEKYRIQLATSPTAALEMTQAPPIQCLPSWQYRGWTMKLNTTII